MKKPLLLLLILFGPTLDARQPTPQSIVEELLAADRVFSVASGKSDVVSGLSAMFGDDILLMHAGGIASGKANAIDALRQNKANAGAKIEWTPLRAAISGDGRHGFTAGFMNLRTADGKETPLKYLAYWQKQAAGWRVTVYRKSLEDAETAFSNDAQVVGIGPAFTKWGSPDAINLGPPDVPVFIVGNDRIGVGVGVGGGSQAPGSPVRWGADQKTIVAASGDFGVTVGHIVPNAPGADGKPQPGRPFFTIWRRDSVRDPWRYIAE